jgi:hypothetical protein
MTTHEFDATVRRIVHAAAMVPARAPLLARFAELPEEAWQWLVAAAAREIWPEDGGFQETSQAAIAEVRTTAQALLGG